MFGRDGFAILVHIHVRRGSILKGIVDRVVVAVVVMVLVVVVASSGGAVIVAAEVMIHVGKIRVIHGVVTLQRCQRR